LSEATAVLGSCGPEARVLAGGTDLIVRLREGLVRPRVVVDVKRIAELQPSIRAENGNVTLTATAVMADVAANRIVRQDFGALAQAAAVVGSVQIRNRATVAGNVCNASPAADTAPALLIYGAIVVIDSVAGQRRLPLEGFLLGPRRTALGPGEMVSAIELPIPVTGSSAAFARLTRRLGVDLATISVCCSMDSDGVTRFAFGAVGPTAFVVTDRSGVLADPKASPEAKDRVLAALTSEARPISDVRATKEYRAAMLKVLSRRLVRDLTDRRRAA
jgi:CO/xanthine dehydrogenase FAD-binding subunit